jgi:hypothetical protein
MNGLDQRTQPHRTVRRNDAMRERCPLCRAEPYHPCQGRRGDRKSPHAARYEEASR